MKNKLFIVVWDDDQGACFPMAWDTECKGAICVAVGREKIALFPSRKSARKAIDISAKYAALRRSQALPENTDFLEGRSNLRVLECQGDPLKQESEL